MVSGTWRDACSRSLISSLWMFSGFFGYVIARARRSVCSSGISWYSLCVVRARAVVSVCSVGGCSCLWVRVSSSCSVGGRSSSLRYIWSSYSLSSPGGESSMSFRVE